jgi:hypothetical protein
VGCGLGKGFTTAIVKVCRTADKCRMTDLQLQVISETELSEKIQEKNNQNDQTHCEKRDGSI